MLYLCLDIAALLPIQHCFQCSHLNNKPGVLGEAGKSFVFALLSTILHFIFYPSLVYPMKIYLQIKISKANKILENCV